MQEDCPGHKQLVWCYRNPLNDLGVIPGKLAIPLEADQPQAEASAPRNPDVGAGLKPAPTRYRPSTALRTCFRGCDEWGAH